MENANVKKRYCCREGGGYDKREEYKKYLHMSDEELDRIFEENLKIDREYAKKYGLHSDV